VRFFVLAERAADIDTLMLELELTDGPHRLLHIRRCIAAPDFDHSILSLTRVLSWHRRDRPGDD
jgi:hypothetical protein